MATMLTFAMEEHFIASQSLLERWAHKVITSAGLSENGEMDVEE
jgi:hypothetical protein